MQVKALIISIFLAASVAAVPTKSKGHKGGDESSNEDSLNGIGNGIGKDSQNNPTWASNNGDGSTFGTNDGHNNILNDAFNVNYGADSGKISEEVVAAMKSLTLTCHSHSDGVMSCRWES
ncbi:hypothetical protein ONZ43_g355 [Nemania bipapillata]|uniref:Uncharacterized protein n=1 Tax=Nemania bipapillata TaxID=110536 RepID=A0ACC2J8Y5_9PEZI|nr:hypothetical protein ONZ43_g355 [Nemania bipapillata]